MTLRIPRRRFLSGVALSLLGGLVAGCGHFLRWLARADNSGFEPVSYSFETSDLCLLNAEAIRGPFYIPKTLVRREIAEGHAGAPLRLRFQVVDVDGCRALAGMAVEAWHCDARGAYTS
jgi:hypothetical protein